jgi:hypothetical protein
MQSAPIEISCAKVSELASEYVEETLPASLARAVADHARTCATCGTICTLCASYGPAWKRCPKLSRRCFFTRM